MKIDKLSLVTLLSTMFEPDLAEEMADYPVVKVPGETVVGEEGDPLKSISLVLTGSVRAVKIDRGGEEIHIYNMNELQSCIISLTMALQDRESSKLCAITNEETTLLSFPKGKANEWLEKYPSWRRFTVDLYETRLYELLTNHQTVKDQKTNILESIKYAQRIQNAVLPPDEMISEVLPEHFILYLPRDIVSGDYYWLTKNDNRIVIAVADCTGHGVPGAFMSMLGITLLNQHSKKNDSLHANEILDELRESVIHSLRQDGSGSETKDGMDMSLVIINPDTKNLEFAGANNPLFVIRDGELIKLHADKMPVGVYVGKTTKFTRKDFAYREGDCFYAFSDGYVDQFGGTNNKKFLSKNFSNLLLRIHNRPMEEQKVILDQTIKDWRGDKDQVDDILVMGFRL